MSGTHYICEKKNTIVRALRVLKNYSKRGSIFFKQA